MSIGSALQAGVNGLRAQATKLATISDNIANSSTVGYRRSTVDFSSLVVGDTSDTNFTAGGLTTTVRTEVSDNGGLISTSSQTDLGITGRGFFAVTDGIDGSGSALTRAGSFLPDQFGNLQNAGGYFLQGFPLERDGTFTNGAPSLTTFESLETVNIGNIQGTAQPTTFINFAGNVPSGDAGPFQAGIQYFDEFGASQTLTLNWVANGGPGSNVWDLEVYDGTTGGTLITTLNGIDFTGGGPGAVAGNPDYPGAAPVSLAPGYNVINYNEAAGTFDIVLPGPGAQTLTLNLGTENTLDGVTQFGGDFTPQTQIDGSALGELLEIDFREDGTLVAIFDNGEVRPIYQIPLVDVLNPDGLRPLDGNAFQLSADSGSLRVGLAGSNGTGTISAGVLEESNVDVAEELTTLIETQRAYSSNATVVQTADEMLEEVTRIGR